MSLKKPIYIWGLRILCFAALLTSIVALQTTRRNRLFEAEGQALVTQANMQERRFQSQTQLLKYIPDFGFRNLLADWTYLQFLQYFGNWDHRDITGYGLSGGFFEVIIERDPYYYDPFYIFLSTSLTLYAAQPERSVELQAKGLESLTPQTPPESFYIWRSKGIDEMLFLGDYEAAQRSHEIGAEWAAQSPDPRGDAAQQSLQETADFLATEPDNPRLRVNAWLQILGNAPDERTQAIVVEEIADLGYEVVSREGGGYSVQPLTPNAN